MEAKEALELSNSNPSKLDEIFRCIKENALRGETECVVQLGWNRSGFEQSEALMKEQIELLESKGYKVSIYSISDPGVWKSITHAISWSK